MFVCCALFALSKMMTEGAEERLQKFLLSSNYVIPSEVEESLGVNLRPWRATTTFGIYIVTNRNHSVLHIRVTNRLSRRIWEHREGNHPGVAADYRCTKLTYYEWYRDIRDAIARESQVKKSSRTKKVVLINGLNPSWRDFGADVLQEA
jgi:putative endonuclease